MKKFNINTICYGIDINLKVLSICNNKFQEFNNIGKSYHFSTRIDENEIKTFLTNNKIVFFDLIVFDRVLYCLNDKSLNRLLEIFSKYTKFIFIDDFQLDKQKISLGYKHRDWMVLLKMYDFENVININTIYSNVENANARTLIFKKNNF